MKAIIPAAGFGTRMLPLTKAQPKEMLPVYDKPVIQYVVEEAVEAGITDIIIVTGRNKRAIEDHFDRNPELERALEKKGKLEMLESLRKINEMANIYYVRQAEQKGLADAIAKAEKFICEDKFAVLLGDNITLPYALPKMMKDKQPSVLVKRITEGHSRYGIVSVDENNRINYLVEKPKEPPSDLAILGRYILPTEIFDNIKNLKPGYGGELQLTDALNEYAKQKEIYAYEYEGKVYDIGNHKGWLTANIEISNYYNQR